MKILLIGKHPRTGGAAIASSRLMEALQANIADVQMLVQEGEDLQAGVYSTTHGKLKKGLNLFRFIWERLVFLPRERSSNIRFLFSLANTGESIVQNRKFKEADIIHLHWINAGFLSLKSLREIFQSGKAIVWTFHDMWPFTGGCHYALDCKEYIHECGMCPYLKKPGKRDLSHQIWKKKEKLFRESQVTVITPSLWLGDCVRKSSLLGHWNVTGIHNPVNHELFRPKDRAESCRNLGLDPAKKHILFGAATMKNVLKGFSYFKEAMQSLSHSEGIGEEVEILLFGKTSDSEEASFPLKTRNIAFVNSPEVLVDLYNAAWLFAIPSLQDNLPNTIIEAMLCGTPVVGFNTGGIPEMIDHKVNGYLAEYKSAGDLAKGVEWVLSSESYEKLSDDTRKSALHRFSMEQSVQQHMELYRKIYNKEEE